MKKIILITSILFTNISYAMMIVPAETFEINCMASNGLTIETDITQEEASIVTTRLFGFQKDFFASFIPNNGQGSTLYLREKQNSRAADAYHVYFNEKVQYQKETVINGILGKPLRTPRFSEDSFTMPIGYRQIATVRCQVFVHE